MTMLMAKDKNDRLSKETPIFHVIKMLADIPKDLVDIFTPDGEDELVQLEVNIVKWLNKVLVREKVMKLQKHFDLPLRPNQSLRVVTIYSKISELKRRKRKFRNDGDSSSDKGSSAI